MSKGVFLWWKVSLEQLEGESGNALSQQVWNVCSEDKTLPMTISTHVLFLSYVRACACMCVRGHAYVCVYVSMGVRG